MIAVSSFQLMLAVMAICLSPIYVLPSGNPQPTDMVWALFVVSMLLLSPGPLFQQMRTDKFTLVLLLLGGWIAVVSILNAIYYSDGSIFFPVYFYVYNVSVAIAFLTFLKLHGDRYKKALIGAFMIAVGVILVYWMPDVLLGSRRATGPFNNPNQLAYFALLVAGILILMTHTERRVSIGITITLGILSLYLMTAASLSALAAFTLMVLGFLLTLKGSFSLLVFRVLLIVLLLVPFLYIFLSTGFGDEIQRMFLGRFDVLGRKVENVASSRGYVHILEYPEQIFLGAGERGRDRFYFSQEIHSSFGTMLFSYGVVGVGLYLAVLWFSAIRGRAYHFLILLSPVLYSLTHQGLRFTLFWVFLVVVYWTSTQQMSSVVSQGHTAGHAGVGRPGPYVLPPSSAAN